MLIYLFNILNLRKILIFSFFIIVSCSNLTSLKDNYGKDQILLTKKQQERFISYLNGKYFSYEFGRDENLKSPIAFAITKDGYQSLILMCDDYIKKCANDIYILQTISKHSKKANSKFYIFAFEKKIVWNGINQYVKNKSDFLKVINSTNSIKVSKLLETKKIKFYDKIFSPSETDNCDEDNC